MHFDVEDIVISKFHQLHCMNCKKNAIDEFLEFNMSNFHQLQNSNMSQKSWTTQFPCQKTERQACAHRGGFGELDIVLKMADKLTICH